MTSKSTILILLALILLPISISGEEFSIDTLFSEMELENYDSLVELETESEVASFYEVIIEDVSHWVIAEEANTKSGTVIYVAILDSTLEIVQFAIPVFKNKHNASLTSSSFLRQFRREQPAKSPIRIGYGVDAISGATSSTNSLIDAVNSSVIKLDEIVTSSVED